MARLLYSATVSLDGFMAGPGGDMQWLIEHLGPNPMVDGLVPHIGALLVGRRTFDGDDPHRDTEQEGAFEGTWHGPQVVLTHRPPRQPVSDVEFVDDLGRAVAAARRAAGTLAYVNILGGDVGRQCLAAGVVDEIMVCVAPVLLGDGVPFFSPAGGTPERLVRIEAPQVEHVTNLWYRVQR